LSSSFKEKRERKAGLGYVLDFDSTPLTPEDRKLAEVKITDTEMNALVELGFQEAALICTQLLRIPASKPTENNCVKLRPLGEPAPKKKATAVQGDDSDSDPDCNDDNDEPDHDEDEVPESRVVELAARDAARYSALCDDYEGAVKEAESIPTVFGPPLPPSPSHPAVALPLADPVKVKSEIIDNNGKLSIAMIVQARLHWQSGTTTKSEKVVRIDSKYALSRIARGKGLQHDDDTEPEKMSIQEASNAVRVIQDLNSATHTNKPRKYREMRWKDAATAIQKLVNSSGKLFLLWSYFSC
jgi:hypothetical protein